jgi:hypothetical protein
MAAAVIGAIDKQPAHAHVAHLGEILVGRSLNMTAPSTVMLIGKYS